MQASFTVPRPRFATQQGMSSGAGLLTLQFPTSGIWNGISAIACTILAENAAAGVVGLAKFGIGMSGNGTPSFLPDSNDPDMVPVGSQGFTDMFLELKGCREVVTVVISGLQNSKPYSVSLAHF